jgi:hypothetical protein
MDRLLHVQLWRHHRRPRWRAQLRDSHRCGLLARCFRSRSLPGSCILPDVLVYCRGAVFAGGHHPGLGNSGGCILSMLSAFFVFLILPDYPETATWLTQDDKALAASRLAVQGSRGSGAAMTWQDAKLTLLEWRLWAHYHVRRLGKHLFASLTWKSRGLG